MPEPMAAVTADPASGNAPVAQTTDTPSASVEETPSGVGTGASEKTEITQSETSEGDSQEAAKQSVPYDRFKEKVDEVNQIKEAYGGLSPEEVRSMQENAKLLENLKSNPELASAFLKNQAQMPQVNPVQAKADEQLQAMGYVKAEDVESKVNELFNQRELQRTFIDKVTELESKYDGTNGLPKFDAKEVAEFMDKYGYTSDANGYPDVEAAFKYKYMDSFIDSKAKQNTSTTFTEKPGARGSRQGSDNSKAELEEAKKTGNWRDILLKRSPFPA